MSDFQHSYALVIGINDYSNGISSLKTAVSDATEIAHLLETKHHYTVTLLPDRAATLSQLQQVLETELPKRIQAGDRFLFYFAGHGIALNGEDGPEGYLIPQNAKFGNVSTYLRMSEVNKALLQLPCRHFLGILDCCFAGAFRWSSTRKAIPIELGTIHKERYDRFIQDPAWQVLTSAAYDQSAWDAFDLKDERGQKGVHSPFACALIEALEGKADAFPPAEPGKPAGDGVITASELYLYLRDRVEIATEARAIRQTPGIHCLNKHDKGEYIFLTPGHALNLPPAPPLDASQNPYRGLSPFEEEHCDLFFGRNVLTQKLYEFVTSHTLTIVLGASGSGKSSLVKAGLIPKLRQCKNGHAWFILPPVRPGESPFKALNNALASVNLPAITTCSEATSSGLLTPAESLANWFKEHPKANLLLVVDQFEELITLCRDDQERQQFLEALAGAIATYPSQIYLVLTLRSDFEPQFRNAALEKDWQTARFVVPAMTREELRQAIEEPASARVMYFDPHELVEQLIDEVANMPGALPLLSFALSELYLKYLKRQEDAKNRGETSDRAITQADYEELGGVTRSLTQRAEQEYGVLSKRDSAYAQTIRHVMLRMVAVGGELARRQVPESELKYPEPENTRVQEVIARFLSARLLVSGTDADDNPYIEPAHDALVRGWKKLQIWKKEEEENLILQRRLTPAAIEWNSVKNKNKEQPKGILDKAYSVLDWLDRRLLTIENLLNKIPAQFAQLLKRSREQQSRSREKPVHFLWDSNPYLDLLDKELYSDDNWLNQVESKFVQESVLQKRRNVSWRWRIAFGVMLGLSGLTIAALIQWRNSELNRANSLGRYSLSLFNEGKELDAFVEAVKAGKILQKQHTIDPEVIHALQKVLYESLESNQLEYSDNPSPINSISISCDGKTLASGSNDGTITLWNLKTGEKKTSFKKHNQSVNSLSFSPNCKILASGSNDGIIILWNVETGKEIRTLNGHDGWVTSVSFSPDGKTLASGNRNKVIKLWDVRTGQEKLPRLKGHDNTVASVSFSPNGKILASCSLLDFTIKLWNVETGKEIRTLKEHNNAFTSISFSPDGKILATGSIKKIIKLWNVETGKEIRTLKGPDGFVTSLSFSPEGKILASGSSDKTIKLWNVETGQESRTLKGHDGIITSLSFSPEGKILVSGSLDKTIKLWNLEAEQEIRTFRGHDSYIKSISFSPHNKILASSEGKTIQLRNVETRKEIHTLKGHDSYVNSISFSPDSKILASGSFDKTIKLWNLEAGKEIRTLKGHDSYVNSMSFSPDGKILASGSSDKTIKLWNVETRKEIYTLKGNSGSVGNVSFSSDGKTLASSGGMTDLDFTIKLWNVETGTEIRTLKGHNNSVTSISFSPDGKTLASGSQDKTIKLWNVGTGTEIRTLNGHKEEVTSVSFSSDSKTLASGSLDKTIKIWNLDLNLDSLMGRSCDWIDNYLKHNPNVIESDRRLCDGIGTKKR